MALTPLASAADRIYWANDEGGSIAWANLNGTGGQTLNTSGAQKAAPNGMAIDSPTGKVYWANYGTAGGGGTTISYANLDGSGGAGNLSGLGATVTGPHGLAMDPATRTIYWVNYSGDRGGEIHYGRLNAAGTGVLNVSELNTAGASVEGPRSLAIDPAAGLIYWANFDPPPDGSVISWARLNGSGGGDINPGSANVYRPEGVAIDPVAGRIYWGNFSDPNDGSGFFGSTISWASLSVSGLGGDLNTGTQVFYPHGVAIDPVAGRIYWPNFYPDNNPTISYARLNGSGGSTLSTVGATLNHPDLPVILTAPSGTGAPTVSGGSGVGDTLSCTQGSWAPDMVSSLFYRAPQSLSYQWSRNGADIGGATSSSYTSSSGGEYRCTVTARNAAGTAQQASSGHTIVAGGSAGGGSDGGSSSGSPIGSHAGKVYTCRGKAATIRAATSSDAGAVRGSRHADVIMGTSGNDVLVGGRGNDIICGRGGDDTLKGGDGNDKLIGGGGRDVLLGRRGRDLLVGGPERDVCFGGPGIDIQRRCEKG